MYVARRSLPVSREYRHQAKPDAKIGMWRCLVLIFARDMERPKCRVHVHGHARHFSARSVIDHNPIMTSVCVQVPRDTGRLSALPSDLISALIFGVRAVLGSMMYLRRGYTVNTTLFGHHRCESLESRRCSPSPHRTAGGPRKLVRGMASAMGNNRGVSIPPSFPSLGLHRNLY